MKVVQSRYMCVLGRDGFVPAKFLDISGYFWLEESG